MAEARPSSQCIHVGVITSVKFYPKPKKPHLCCIRGTCEPNAHARAYIWTLPVAVMPKTPFKMSKSRKTFIKTMIDLMGPIAMEAQHCAKGEAVLAVGFIGKKTRKQIGMTFPTVRDCYAVRAYPTPRDALAHTAKLFSGIYNMLREPK